MKKKVKIITNYDYLRKKNKTQIKQVVGKCLAQIYLSIQSSEKKPKSIPTCRMRLGYYA